MRIQPRFIEATGTASSTTFLRGDGSWAAPSAGSLVSGTTVIDFGANPGLSNVSLAVASPSILAGSIVNAWIYPVATTDHSVDEHIIDPPRVAPASVVAGTGFTIHAVARGNQTTVYGKWTVAWSWS